MIRSYYSSEIVSFCKTDRKTILGELVTNSEFPVEETQRKVWLSEIDLLQEKLSNYTGKIYLEYSIPRMGKRIDVVLIIKSIIFILEFKDGESQYHQSAKDQVVDYALDLLNFHETSHDKTIAPILVVSHGSSIESSLKSSGDNDKLYLLNCCNYITLFPTINKFLEVDSSLHIDPHEWEKGRYSPTPTIIEAAQCLYKNHSVRDISRNDASAINLTQTTDELINIIKLSKENSKKSICFVTGVPGAGKTLVGLNIATKSMNHEDNLHSVFLSGNGPLVAVLREALARDQVEHDKLKGNKIPKIGNARREVQLFIQNIHHFRDECLKDPKPPLENVALFDEAQRAWNKQQTANFMKRKKGIPHFNKSEPEYLISCMDRHREWAVIICLVGGGQEINTGEAGIGEWISALQSNYPNWDIYISDRLTDSEYKVQDNLHEVKQKGNVTEKSHLHLSVSLRSFRNEKVSALVKMLLDIEERQASNILKEIEGKYPIVITRDIGKAKLWLKQRARGSERYGILVSSQAVRLKPFAIDIRPQVDPIHWFLEGKSDIRSSYYLEDVATEFQVQGLELDWTCVVWDADFRYNGKAWDHRSFARNTWQNINKPERKTYLMNAYRVLLTRARQGMVIVVPPGDQEDATRKAEYYDPTYNYLKSIGFPSI